MDRDLEILVVSRESPRFVEFIELVEMVEIDRNSTAWNFPNSLLFSGQ